MTVTAHIEPETKTAFDDRVQILNAVPVVRYATLVRHTPPLTEQQTKDAHAIVSEAWAVFSEEYRDKVSELTHVSATKLQFAANETKVRWRKDGKTPMIDFPRLRTDSKLRERFDQRSCVALCIDTFSSKVWTRIGPPEGEGCPVADVKKRTATYRKVAKEFGVWFHEKFFAMTRNIFESREANWAVGYLEVITLGLQVTDEPEEYYFDDWLFSNDRPNLRNDALRLFISDAANIQFDLRELEAREPKSYWISIPHTVELPNHEFESRTFLYLVRPVEENSFFVVGIGFDDSGRGELANDVALKISRFLANRL